MADIKTIPEGWMENTLKGLTVSNSEKVSILDLSISNYISTENMEVDIGGVKNATSLPKVSSVSKYLPGDILFSNIRTYFRKLWLSDKIGGASNDVLIFRGNRDIVNEKFLFYTLSQNSFFDYTVKTSKGTKMPRGDKDSINKFPILLPPLSEQQAIARMLSAFDNKIELLREQNETLKKTAQTIFHEWFGQYSVENPDELPEGWRVGRMGEVAELIAGGDRPKNTTVNKTDINTVPIFSNGISNDGLYGYTDIPRITEESITVSARGTIGFVSLRIAPYVPIVRLIAIIPDNAYISGKYLFLWLKNQNISGTGTTQQQITVPSFSNLEIIIPTNNIINKFTLTVNSLYEKISENNSQIQSLSKIRDELLLRLMSGEVRI